MQPALAAIWLSVLLGAALGIWQRVAPRVTEPIRTFAVVAAALVVFLSLLPHALECEGIVGLLGAALGYVALPVLERAGMALFHQVDPRALRLELGYAGLLLHRFGDGVTMSVDGHGHGVLWALGAHEVPIVALVTLAFAPRGLGVALGRATMLGVSSSLGYFLVSALPAERWEQLHGWADAAAAGVLLHIVAHEGARLHAHSADVAAEPPRSLPQRALDLGAGALACGLIAALGLDHDSGALALLQHLLQLALQVSPWLCLGLVSRAALRTASRLHTRPLEALSRLVDPTTLALSAALLGPLFTAVHGALALVLSAGLFGLELRARRASGAKAPPSPAPLPSFAGALEQQLVQLAGWVLLGLLAAGYVEAYVTPLGEAAGSPFTRVLWAATVAGLACGSTAASLLLAAALAAKGLPLAAALAGLLLGATAPLLLGGTRSLGLAPRTARPLLLLAAATACIVAALPATALPALQFPVAVPAPSALSWLALAALLAFVLRHIWQTGVRTWLISSLGAALWPHADGHHERASHGHG